MGIGHLLAYVTFAMTVALFAAVAVALATGSTSDGGWSRLLSFGIFVAIGLWSWRMARAGIYVDDHGVAIRPPEPWREERIAWADVEGFDVAPVESRPKDECLRANLVDGRSLAVDWLSRRSPSTWLGTKPRGIAASLNRAQAWGRGG